MIDSSRCLLAVSFPMTTPAICWLQGGDVQLLLDGATPIRRPLRWDTPTRSPVPTRSSFAPRRSPQGRRASDRHRRPVAGLVQQRAPEPQLHRAGLIAVIMMIIAAMLTSLTIAGSGRTGRWSNSVHSGARARDRARKMAAYFVWPHRCTHHRWRWRAAVQGALRGNPLLCWDCCIFLIGVLFGHLPVGLHSEPVDAYQLAC